MTDLFDRIVDQSLLIRRINVTANRVLNADAAAREDIPEQLDLFTDYAARAQRQADEQTALQREQRIQETLLSIRRKYGKNAILKGMNLDEGATARERNGQIGGHKA